MANQDIDDGIQNLTRLAVANIALLVIFLIIVFWLLIRVSGSDNQAALVAVPLLVGIIIFLVGPKRIRDQSDKLLNRPFLSILLGILTIFALILLLLDFNEPSLFTAQAPTSIPTFTPTTTLTLTLTNTPSCTPTMTSSPTVILIPVTPTKPHPSQTLGLTNTPTAEPTSIPATPTKATIATFIPPNTIEPTQEVISPFVNSATTQKVEVHYWGPGSGDHAQIIKGEQDKIKNVRIQLRMLGSHDLEGTMLWESKGPVGSETIEIKGTYYISLQNLDETKLWSFLESWNDDEVVMWLTWTRSDSSKPESTVAIVTNTGQMRGAVYNDTNGTLIWTFVAPRQG